jgi:hypothetical protein
MDHDILPLIRMRTEPLARADRRLILVAALLAAVSVFYTARNYSAALPAASIDLRLSKTEITAKALAFLGARGLSPAGFRNVTLFDPDDEARVYLEREVGLEEANRLMRSEVAVWRWRARWFRPPAKEEMVVYLSPGGRVAGFRHEIAETAPGAKLDREEARRLATDFLASQTHDPQRLVEEQLQERPARYDYVFTWEREGFRAKDATYRRTVVMQGASVGSYSEYLYVPEQWKREYAKLRSGNELYSLAAEVLFALLALAAVGLLIGSLRRREIRWRPLILIAGAVGALMAINEWNSLPFFIDSMPTSSPYMQSLLYGLLLGLGSGAGVFFYVILAAAPGEPLYRASQPDRLSLLKLPTLGAIRTREFFRATVAGYGFAAVHLAFVVAFYLVGRRFGVWSPQDVNYSDFLSTGLPWIYPLTMALMASTSEEFWFRLLAIPLLKRYLRSTWLAVVIPAFLWGFLHSNYPQQPGYIRGIEVGIIGVAAGFLMLRFGILATLIWHYTVDAVMIGMFLFHGGSWYFQLSGCLVAGAVLFPLAVSLVFYWRHGGFLVDPGLLNSGQETAAESAPAPVEAVPAVEPLGPRWKVKWLYYAAGAAAVAGLALPSATEYGGFIRVRQSRAQAEAIAARELGARVPGLNAWRRVTTFQANLETEEFEYLRRVAGSRAANDAVREHTATGLWMVRYFQPLRVEEWRVWVSQQGTVAKVDHILDDKAPGARLAPEEARRLAESYLAKDRSMRSGDLRLVDSASDSKDRRTDHSFVWENNTFHLGEAKARIWLGVQGDEISGVRRYLKLPEEWVREFQRPRLTGILIPGAAGAVGFLLLILFIRRLSGAGDAEATRFHWRTYAALGVSGAGLAALSALNCWPFALAGYDTAKPIESFQSEFVIGRILAIALIGFGLFAAALAADVFLQWAADGSTLRRPSLARAAAVFGLLWGVVRIQACVAGWLPGPRFFLPLWDLPGADTYWPAVTLLAFDFVAAGGALCAATVVVCAATRLWGPRGRYALIAATALLLAVERAQTVPQFAAHWGLGLLAGGVLVLLLRTCAADLLTFGVALFWLAAARQAAVLVQQPETILRWNGVACLAVAFAAGAVVLHPWWDRRFRLSFEAG